MPFLPPIHGSFIVIRYRTRQYPHLSVGFELNVQSRPITNVEGLRLAVSGKSQELRAVSFGSLKIKCRKTIHPKPLHSIVPLFPCSFSLSHSRPQCFSNGLHDCFPRFPIARVVRSLLDSVLHCDVGASVITAYMLMLQSAPR